MDTIEEKRFRAGIGRIWIAPYKFEQALKFLAARAVGYSTSEHWILVSGLTKDLMRDLAANRIEAHLYNPNTAGSTQTA
jgi:hypothetical protein